MSALKPQKKDDKPAWQWSNYLGFLSQLVLVVIVYRVLATRDFIVPAIFYWLVMAAAALAVLLMALGMVKRKISYIWWEALLLIFAFLGIWLLCLAVLPTGWALLAAAAVTVLPYIWPWTAWHDMSFILGCSGLGLFFALQFPYVVLLVCGLGVVAYEASRIGQTQMATLLSEAFDVGIPPGILLPSDLSGCVKPINRVWQAGQGVVVGFLPYIFTAAIALRLMHISWYWLAALGILGLAANALWGLDKQRHVRSWIFLAIAVGCYAFSGLML